MLFIIIFALCAPVLSAGEGFCALPLPSYLVPWQDQPSRLEILWDASKVCHDTRSCYGVEAFPSEGDMLHQLSPVLTQPQSTVIFWTSTSDISFFVTDETGFKGCLFSHESTSPVPATPPLQTGSNYFIANSTGSPWMKCEAGQRVNITVLAQKCHPDFNSSSSSSSSSAALCSSLGRCVAIPRQTAYKCLCCQSHIGEYCENVDGCYTNKLACLNGGTCVDGADLSPDVSTFSCKCIEGYTGRYCELRNTDSCPRNECSNGGACRLNAGGGIGFQCTCPAGFYGDLCEGNVNECLSSPCLNNGTCKDGSNSYACTCQEGFVGMKCEQDTRPCRPGVCLNGATCVEEDGTAKCECPIGFSGATCAIEVVSCEAHPCSIHSIDCVVDTDNNFACVCTPGYSGQKCDVDIDECASNPCTNGTCIDRVAGYQCRCLDGSLRDSCLTPTTNNKEALVDSATTTTSSSSSSSTLSIAVGVVVVLVLVTMLILLVLYFARSGILRSRRQIYSIDVGGLSLKDRLSGSPSSFNSGESYGDPPFPDDSTSFSSKFTPSLFKRSVRKTERF